MEGVNGAIRHAHKPAIIPILRTFGASIGSRCDVETALVIHNADNGYRNLVIGPDCHLGKEVFLDLRDRISIGSRVTISMRATLLTHMDVGRSPLAEHYSRTSSGLTLQSGAYIGANAVLLAGCDIGESAVVGAGAVVTGAVPPLAVAIGVPAE